MRFYRFSDLVRLGIVSNRMTLLRWQRDQGFPQTVKLGPNSAAWPADDVDSWCRNRPTNRQVAA